MKNQTHASTQSHLDIEDIRDDLVILKNGKVDLVLETTAINFSLLSEMEQDARINGFAGLLNSLNFPLQVFIHTESVDITKYIAKIKEYKKNAKNEKIALQIDYYLDFIKGLIEKNEVLDKRFFLIIPYYPETLKKTNPIKTAMGKEERILNIDGLIEKAKIELIQRKDTLIKLLLRMGLRTKQLTTEDLINLFYKLYNSDSISLNTIKSPKEDFLAPIVSSEVDFISTNPNEIN